MVPLRINLFEMKRNNPFKGMGVALVTPFDADGSVDFAALRELVDMHLSAGTDFLCVLGTTAETPCLDEEEKAAVIQVVKEQVAGRIPLLLGCGGNFTAAVTRFLKEANLDGYDGVLVVTPYYNKPTQEGLYRHYCAVAGVTELPVVLYNVPGRTGVNLSAGTTLRVARECPNVVAVKEASGRISQIEEIIAAAPEGFEVLSGDDGITFELLTLGATGVISVVGNAYPSAFRSMVQSALSGDLQSALSVHRRFAPLYKLMTVDGNPSGIKSLLSVQGKICNSLRLPLVPASEATESSLREIASSF